VLFGEFSRDHSDQQLLSAFSTVTIIAYLNYIQGIQQAKLEVFLNELLKVTWIVIWLRSARFLNDLFQKQSSSIQ
jgi:hypothetical protein